VAKVNANPDRLRDLAKKLTAQAQQLDTLKRTVMRDVGAAEWDDQEKRKFEQELVSDLGRLNALADRLRTHYPAILHRKAKALDDFRR
jgi:hypothetical protein